MALPEVKVGFSPEDISEIAASVFEEKFRKVLSSVDGKLKSDAISLAGISGAVLYKTVISLPAVEREINGFIIKYYEQQGWKIEPVDQVGDFVNFRFIHPYAETNQRLEIEIEGIVVQRGYSGDPLVRAHHD